MRARGTPQVLPGVNVAPMHFRAPWGWKLKASTLFVCIVVGIPAAWLLSLGHMVGVVMAAVVLSGLPFMIRGYTITPTHLEIHRLGWTTRWPLEGLREAAYRPGVMAWSWRTWGNGGLFAVHGWFRNQALGSYRAFVNDTERTVVLRWPARTVVVSPAEPERFVQVVQESRGLPAPGTTLTTT